MKQHMLFTKQYNWSSPFMISEVDQFTLKSIHTSESSGSWSR